MTRNPTKIGQYAKMSGVGVGVWLERFVTQASSRRREVKVVSLYGSREKCHGGAPTAAALSP